MRTLLGSSIGTGLRFTSYEKVAEGYGGKGPLLTDAKKIDETIAEAKRLSKSGGAGLHQRAPAEERLPRRKHLDSNEDQTPPEEERSVRETTLEARGTPNKARFTTTVTKGRGPPLVFIYGLLVNNRVLGTPAQPPRKPTAA